MYTLKDLESRKIAVALPTRKKYKDFTEWLESEGRVWRGGEFFSDSDGWRDKKSKTALAYCRSAWGAGPVDWHKEKGFKIITLLDIDTSKTNLEDRVEIIEERLGTVTETLDKVLKIIGAEKLEAKEPKYNEGYRFINKFGKIDGFSWEGGVEDKHNLAIGNCFWGDGEQEACEMYKLRLESMAKAWIPGEGEKFYYWHFSDKSVYEINQMNNRWRLPSAALGACFKTSQECAEWGETYAKAFEYLA